MEVIKKPPQRPSRSADKLVEALATLSALLDRTINEVHALDRDFQHQLKQSIQDTETTLHAKSLQQIEATREEVSQSLTGRFQKELKTAMDGLRSEFKVEREKLQRELRDVLDEASRLKKEKAQLTADVQRARQEGEAGVVRMKEAGVAELENLRKELTTSFKKESRLTVETLRSGFEEERDRLLKEVRHRTDAAAQSESEKAHLTKKLEQVREDTAVQLEKAREEMGSKSKRELQETIDKIAAELNAERDRLNAEFSSANAERERLRAECERLIDERDRTNRDLRAATDRGARIAAEVDELAAQIVQARADGAAGIEKVRGESSARVQKESQAAIEALKEEFRTERDTLNKELRHAIDAAAKLEAERSGLISEVQRVKDQAAVDVAKALADSAPLKAAVAKGARKDSKDVGANEAKDKETKEQMKLEIKRIEARLNDVLKAIDDPQTELSAVIRKNVEKSELEAYLKGIRYALGA